MTVPVRREVEHAITVYAGASDVYRSLADIENWPRLFPPSVYVDYAERNGNEERIRVWAMANGEAKSWTSRRVLDPDALTIQFWQEVSAPPVAEMSGTWIIEPAGERETRLRLRHEYRAIDDDPDGLDWIERAVDTNSNAELPSLKDSVERATARATDLTLSFSDTVRIEGAVEDVYDFVNDAHLWSERLPHVANVTLTEHTPGLQTLRMDTRTKDGSTHTTESVRVCFKNHKIAYKQTTTPALMTTHTGYWLFEPDPNGAGVLATSEHTVVINPENIGRVLGADADLAKARTFVRTALSANSTATLEHAKAYAESRR